MNKIKIVARFGLALSFSAAFMLTGMGSAFALSVAVIANLSGPEPSRK